MIKPHWVPWELVELASDDMHMTEAEFVSAYADIEAYTSCDDEGDDLHECDGMAHYLGPTKWLHLTPNARDNIDDVHFKIWEEVWSRPHAAVDLADKVSKDVFRYYNEFMLERRPEVTKCPTDRPLVRVKVVPASFGLEGFEDAVWEATEDLIINLEKVKTNYFPSVASTTEKGYCEAFTFVVAAPDLFTDPTLIEGGKAESPQVEFEPSQFRGFTSAMIKCMPMDNPIKLTPFHPMWHDSQEAKQLDGRGVSGVNFPYPCVAVSGTFEV